MADVAPPDAGEILFGALGTRLSALGADIVTAGDVATLVALAPRIRELGLGMLALDAGAELTARTVARLNDFLTERMVHVIAASHALPHATWCWLSMGSEGRGEQTFVTDQDNGLMFSAANDTEARELRRCFLPFAREVNEALAACGFPLCQGEIMASHPDCCLSCEEWRERFAYWIRVPDPQALLNATIFFDFRALYGDIALAERLRRQLLSLTSANTVFLRLMGANALAVLPPLGLLGDVVAENTRDGVDLKKLGTRLFVDAARILALGEGLSPLNTVERLRAIGAAGVLNIADAEASIMAFTQIQHLRLQGQRKALLAGLAAGNHVKLDALNEFERRLLREALKQARRLQRQLKLIFSIEG